MGPSENVSFPAFTFMELGVSLILWGFVVNLSPSAGGTSLSFPAMLKIIIFYLCHFSKILVKKRNWGTEGWSNLLGGVASHHGRGGTRVYKPSDEAFGSHRMWTQMVLGTQTSWSQILPTMKAALGSKRYTSQDALCWSIIQDVLLLVIVPYMFK